MSFLIEVNGEMLKAKKGATLLTTLHEHHINVPALCNIKSLLPTGACRLCVVEMIDQGNRLAPSCSMAVYEGMKVKTHSEKVIRARKTIVELLLANHPDDCLYCDNNMKCELQNLARELVVTEKRFEHCATDKRVNMDLSSPSIVRDPAKCILCGRCVRVCEEIQDVAAIDFIGRGCESSVGTAFDEGLNTSSCINCGQCIIVCPTGALVEKNSIHDVAAALNDPDKFVIVQHAPSISVTLGAEFGFPASADIAGVMTSAFRMMGFNRVFDTSFSADLTIMEEASELAKRLTGKGGPLPMFTSCSPGWVKFCEQYYPDILANLSTCKSPQQMMGAVIKSYYAKKAGIDPKKIYSVSVMPCTAKKFEAGRNEMMENNIQDIDAVLTTRELAKMIKTYGIALHDLKPQEADDPLCERSSAGKIFGVTGGVMEAAIRTANFLLTNKELDNLVVKDVRELEGRKEAKINVAGTELGVAVVSGLGNARKIIEEIKAGRDDLHFVEVMTCPGGCIAGGGQLIGLDPHTITNRMKAIYKIDKNAKIRTSHSNKSIQKLYKDFLGKPLGHKSHKLLHTKYVARPEIY